MNERKQVNIQGDREFQALSEYIIAFLKRLFYSDKNFKKTNFDAKEKIKSVRIWT